MNPDQVITALPMEVAGGGSPPNVLRLLCRAVARGQLGRARRACATTDRPNKEARIAPRRLLTGFMRLLRTDRKFPRGRPHVSTSNPSAVRLVQ